MLLVPSPATMQKLHLVGFTADFEGLIFSTRKGAKSGSFVVPVDARLLKQIAELDKQRNGPQAHPDEHRGAPRLVRPESSLSPREMQDRIRAGWTLDEVAAEAGVDLDWVRRFASPVLAEVRHVIDAARETYFDKPRFGMSTQPLGPSVRRNVLERGVRMTDEELDDCWSAYQLDDTVWVVRFSYLSRGHMQEAEWRFDTETDDLASRNRLASQLGFVTKGRSKKSATVAPVKPPKPSAKAVKAHKASQDPRPIANGVVARPAARSRASTTKKRASSTKKAAKKRARAPVEPPPQRLAPARTTRDDTPAWRPTPPVAAKPAPVSAGPAPVARPSPPPPPPVARPTPVAVPAREPQPQPQPRPQPPPRPRPPEPPVERPPARAEAEEVRRPPPPPPPPQAPPRAPERPAPPPPPPPPPPAPRPVPDVPRVAAASPLGDASQPPRPGPVDVDPDTGIAHIDSRRMWHDVPPAGRRPVFRDANRAGDDTPVPATKPKRRPRRTEPLRAR
jgi:hypothetical protein